MFDISFRKELKLLETFNLYYKNKKINSTIQIKNTQF